MRSDLIRGILAGYAEQRAANAAEEARRREEAVGRDPAIGTLLRARQELIFSGVRSILARTGSADALPERMEAANREIRERLVQNGFPADWLEPVCRCPLCRDTGYVGETLREECSCLKRAYAERVSAAVGLEEDHPQTFDTWSEELVPDSTIPGKSYTQRDIAVYQRDFCRAWADAVPDEAARTLVLSGGSGLGKTFLMHAMAHRLAERGRGVLLVTAYRLIDTARRAYFAGALDELEPLMEAETLMVDDLGTEPLMQNVTIEQLYNILNERQAAGRFTVFSTNLTVPELKDRYTERIASRLTDRRAARVLVFEGEDLRKQ